MTFEGKKMLNKLNETALLNDDVFGALVKIQPLDHNLDDSSLPKYMIFGGCSTDGTYNPQNEMPD